MNEKKLTWYKKPTIYIQEVELEQYIAMSKPVIHPSDGTITEDWGEETIYNPSGGDIDLKDY